MLPDDVIKKIQFEISEIDEEISAYNPLLKKCKMKEPDFIEMTALASSLHSLYNGIEKIFIIIAKNVDKRIPSGQKWHHELLNEMKSPLIFQSLESDGTRRTRSRRVRILSFFFSPTRLR